LSLVGRQKIDCCGGAEKMASKARLFGFLRFFSSLVFVIYLFAVLLLD
jgi:hypothetical protein